MSDEGQTFHEEAAAAYAKHQQGVASGEYALTIQHQKNSAQDGAKLAASYAADLRTPTTAE